MFAPETACHADYQLYERKVRVTGPTGHRATPLWQPANARVDRPWAHSLEEREPACIVWKILWRKSMDEATLPCILSAAPSVAMRTGDRIVRRSPFGARQHPVANIGCRSQGCLAKLLWHVWHVTNFWKNPSVNRGMLLTAAIVLTVPANRTGSWVNSVVLMSDVNKPFPGPSSGHLRPVSLLPNRQRIAVVAR